MQIESPSPSGAAAPSEPPHIELLDRLILDGDRDLPLHAQLRRALRKIIDEHCQDGQKFFTEPQLIKRLNVSQSTVRRALLDLTRAGFLDRRVAKGSFVVKPQPESSVAYVAHVILPEFKSEFFAAVLEAISKECQKKGCRFQVHYTHQGENAGAIFRSFSGSARQDGIVLLANDPRTTLELYEAFDEHHYRVINIDAKVSGYAGTFVGTSNAEVIDLTLNHLCELGHRRIVFFVNEPEEHGNVIERVQVFERAIEERGLTEARVVHCGTHFFEDSYQSAYSHMPELMETSPKPTAIFTMSDPGAWAAMKWLSEKGFNVPSNVSVLGFSDDRPSRFTHPALTTIAHPIDLIAETVLDLLTQPKFRHETRLLSPKLVVRESTGPAV